MKQKETAVTARNVTKIFSSRGRRPKYCALSGLTLSVPSGCIFSLLGPNGAGKSTFIRLLSAVDYRTAGDLSVCGFDPSSDGEKIRRYVSCVSQEPSADLHLNSIENLRFQCALYGLPDTIAATRIRELLSAFKLEQYAPIPAACLSGGIRRRLDLALAFISEPHLLVLDEPTTALDVESRRILHNFIRMINSTKHTTVFMTTHYLEEAEELSDYICLMNRGRIICCGSPAEIRRAGTGNTTGKSLDDIYLELTHTAEDSYAPAGDTVRGAHK